MLIASSVATGVCFFYMQKLYILYFFSFLISNDGFFRSTLATAQNFRTNFFIFKKIHIGIYFKKLFSINLI